jgi:hypothetical protein
VWYKEFLQLIGERVRLKGFSKYRAQLDTKSAYGRAHKHTDKDTGRRAQQRILSDALQIMYCIYDF